MIEAFVAELTDAATDDALRAILIQGAGDDFCSGADWVATNSGSDQRPRTGDILRRIPHGAHRVIELIHGIQLPVVCSVRGFAVGLGCNLALAADFTVAATDAVFWEPFAARGFSPDSGATWLLPRLIGLTRAKRMLLLGDKVGASDAADWGLIHQAVDPSRIGPSDRRTAEPTGRRAHGGTGTGQAGSALRPACDAESVDDPRALRPRTVLQNTRFQRGPSRVPGTTPTRISRPMNHSEEGIVMSSRSYDTIKYEVDGHKATITLNRPDALNALSPHMVTELRDAYAEAENDDAVWLLIVTGTGRAFCTGADVKAIPGDGKVINERPYLSTYEQWEAPQEGTPPFRTMAKPVLAAINGLCCGAGLDWVTTGDIVIASDRATFFDPHVSIGLVAARELVRVARVLPRSIALRMALMGKHERLSAQRAYELGMISEIVDHDRLLERAHEIADIVNSNAPLAVRGTRLAILKGLDLPLHEAEMLAEAFRERNLHTEDSLEGPRAFVEKRPPEWQCR